MKIGDKISVIDENLGGKILSVRGNTVDFADEFGFTHQYPKEKLVLRNPDIYDDSPIEFKAETKKPTSKKHSKNSFLLDLHFEKLVAEPHRYESFERLLIQREKLLETLDFCRKHLKKLEIVHGVGDGVLQKMVYDVLESQTGLDFHDKAILHHQSGAIIVTLV